MVGQCFIIMANIRSEQEEKMYRETPLWSVLVNCSVQELYVRIRVLWWVFIDWRRQGNSKLGKDEYGWDGMKRKCRLQVPTRTDSLLYSLSPSVRLMVIEWLDPG